MNSCSKKITIITPCYNSEKYLPDCLKSIEAQTMPIDDLEIILVNDASTDNTWKLITEFEASHPESVIAINLEHNMRQGGARNIALDYASAEYIMFFDSDDRLADDACEWMYHTAKHYDLDILQGAFFACSNGVTEETITTRAKAGDNIGLFDLSDNNIRTEFLTNAPIPFGCCFKLYNRSLIERVGSRFAEHVMYEEPLFVFPLICGAGKIGVIDEIIMYVRIHADSTMQSNRGQNHRLMEHPKVQLQLLFWLKQHPDLFLPFKDEILFYFVTTFYLETIMFCVSENKPISVYDYEWLRTVILSEIPDYKNNYFITYDTRLLKLMDNMSESFILTGVEELNNYLISVHSMFELIE